MSRRFPSTLALLALVFYLCVGREILGDEVGIHPALSVIPRPSIVKTQGGQFQLGKSTTIYYESGLARRREIANYLAERLRPATGLSIAVRHLPDDLSDPLPSGSIVLTTEAAPDSLGDAGYQLIVKESTVLLRAVEPAGLFYAAQTLRQLLPPEIESDKRRPNVPWSVLCVEIQDQPRYPWRGFMLDSVRHFQTPAFIKRLIDLLSYHKINRFHWHLTDDQGWRIESKVYPRLNSIGSWRGEGEDRYGGFYTQREIREIVEYARQRNIIIVPEIDVPGHSQAVFASYPHLTCTGADDGKPFRVYTEWSGTGEDDAYCVGKKSTYKFLDDIFSEVTQLFPGPYIHVGGDECAKGAWEICPKCQKCLRRNGLKDEYELQSYFIRRVEKILAKKGRQLIGWDEILEGGMSASPASQTAPIMQAWRGMDRTKAGVNAGLDTIASPASYWYFPKSIERVYSLDPTPANLTAEEADHILGGEGCLWTEHAPQETIDGKLFPSMAALSEVLWTAPEHQNQESLRVRLPSYLRRLEELGVEYDQESVVQNTVKKTVSATEP